jgi:hypothetical protein
MPSGPLVIHVHTLYVRFRGKTYIALCIVSGTCIYDQNAVELLKKYGYALIPAHDKNKK